MARASAILLAALLIFAVACGGSKKSDSSSSSSSSDSSSSSSSSGGGVSGTDQTAATKLANQYVLTFLDLLSGSKSAKDLIGLYTPDCQSKVKASDLDATMLLLKAFVPELSKAKIDDVDLGKLDVQKTSNGFEVTEPDSSAIKVKVNGKFVLLDDYMKGLGLDDTGDSPASDLTDQKLEMTVANGHTYLSDCSELSGLNFNDDTPTPAATKSSH